MATNYKREDTAFKQRIAARADELRLQRPAKSEGFDGRFAAVVHDAVRSPKMHRILLAVFVAALLLTVKAFVEVIVMLTVIVVPVLLIALVVRAAVPSR